MKRRLTPESIDDPRLPRGELGGLLAAIRQINHRLAGTSSLLDHLRRWSAAWAPGRRLTLLDVATGSADVPLAAVRWARKAGFDLCVTAIDQNPGVLKVAREQIGAEASIELINVDAESILERFGAGSFDFVHAGLFLHHLSDGAAVAMLRTIDAVAREGVVWNDLMRSRRGVAVGYLLGLGRPRAIRHDIVASLRAGFTRAEAESLAGQAGLSYAAYRENFLAQRFTVAGLKPRREDGGGRPG